MKLAVSSYCGASLPWVPMFGISQPCDWLTGKLMPKMTSNRNSSLNFAANCSKLSKPTMYLKVVFFFLKYLYREKQRQPQRLFFSCAL